MNLTIKDKALVIEALRAHGWNLSGNEKNLPIEELIEKIQDGE
jgi:hypothetical protein